MIPIKRISVSFFIRVDRVDEKDNAPLYVSITSNKKKVKASINRKLPIDRWDDEAQRVIGDDETANTTNQYLDLVTAKIYEAYNQLISQNKSITIHQIKDLALSPENTITSHTLLFTAQDHNDEMHSLLGRKFSYGNYKNYRTTIKYLKRFIQQVYKRKDFELSDLSLSFVKSFENWLLLNTPSKNNGAMKHIQRLNKILNRAMQLGLMEKNPVRDFKIKFQQHDRGFLTQEEIQAIETLELKESFLQNTRDIFLFQIYTGLAYSDVSSLEEKNFVYNMNGNDWIVKHREKTKVKMSVPLLPKAKAILKRLKESNNSTRLFYVPANQKMNYMLKTIATRAGINKNLTTHLARHTFATTITLLNGIPIETVSKMLGHTKISTTQIYSKVTVQKISKDMDKLQDLF